ncbi:MAG: hypothetical protein V2A62_01185 [Candidatus Woesearchaeota archaeon]
MVSRKEKGRGLEFLAEMLARSQKYDFREQNYEHVLIREKEGEKPRAVSVILANYQGSVKDYYRLVKENAESGYYTCPVLYKDRSSVFVRMVDTNLSWRADKSLKRYSPQQINEMLSLRKIEKEILEQTSGAALPYYQPPQERLEESLRRITMNKVILDYSHIGPENQGYGFVHDRESIDYKLPEEIASGKDAAELEWVTSQQDRRIVRIIPIVSPATALAAKQAERELSRTAKDTFPGLNGEDAYRALMGEKF